MDFSLSRLASPLGTMLVVSDGAALRALEFDDYEGRMRHLLRLHYGRYTLTETADSGAAVCSAARWIGRWVGRCLGSYFAGDLAALDGIAVQTVGTAFQRAVWAALRGIPAGTTTTYGRLAAQLGRASASRAVGMANGANPVSIVVPCHRVIGADAKLTGYGGGLHRKAWLIGHERAHCSRDLSDPAIGLMAD